MVKRVLVILILCVIFVFTFTFVSSENVAPSESEQYTILFIPKSQISSFWKITIDGFKTAIAEYNEVGVVLSTSHEEDIEGQIQIVEDAIVEGYDAIIISANSYEGLAKSVQNAINQGVEVVVIDSDVNVEDVKVRISTDNYKAGFEMGEEIAQLMNYQGELGILGFEVYTQNLEDRMKGFTDAVKQYNSITVLETEKTLSTEEDAMRGTRALIEENPQIQAIASFNEIVTVSMGDIIAEMGREDLIAVGFDNNNRVIDYLEIGVLDAIVAQNQFAMGYLGAQNAIQLLHENPVEEGNIDTGVHIVTKENMYDKEIQTILFPFEVDE